MLFYHYKLNATQELVLSILKARLFNDENRIINAEKDVWETVYDFSRQQRVLLVVYDYLRNHKEIVPDDILLKMKKFYLANVARTIRFEEDLIKIKSIFDNAQIPYMLIKGISLSRILYNDPALRISSDMDVIIQRSDLHKADSELLKHDYLCATRNDSRKYQYFRRVTHQWTYSSPHRRNFLELHTKYGPLSRSVTIGNDNIWQRIQHLDLNGNSFSVMSAEDLLLFLVLHNTKELWDDWLQLNDVAALISGNPDLKADEILDAAEKMHCTKRLLLSLLLLEEVFQSSFLHEIIERLFNRYKMKGLVQASLNHLFTPEGLGRGLWSTRTWRDLRLADLWRDRFVVVTHKGLNVLARTIP